MKIALVTGGQPRFTPDFTILLNQLSGFDSADLYLTLWRSDWALDENHARSKIEKILPLKYNLAKVQIVDEPFHETPFSPIDLAPPHPENVQWWYQRIASQLIGLSMAYDLVDNNYDAVIRYRVDGMLDRALDLRTIDLLKNEIIFPMQPRVGEYPTDQFAIGSQDIMKIYFGLGKEFKELIPIADPTWYEIRMHPGYTSAHRGPWGPESLMNIYFKKYNVKFSFGEFCHNFNTFGRSRFTDKHFHHSIVQDPTET